MANLVYACRFEFPSADGITEVLVAYTEWITGFYKKRRGIAGLEFDPSQGGDVAGIPDSHALSSRNFTNNTDRVASIRWSYPHHEDLGLLWINEIRVGQFDKRCSVEHLISIKSVEYNILPARIQLGSPRVIREIFAKAPRRVGDMQVKATVYEFGENDLDTFMKLLTGNRRKLPVVMLAPYVGGEVNLLNAERLANNLAGVAVVVRINDPDVGWDFADEVGRQLSCFNGGARIYWPGFTDDSKPSDHRLFISSWIEKVGPDTAERIIEREIFAVTAYRFVPDKQTSNLIRRVESAERQKLLEDNRSSVDELLEELENALQKIDKLENENAILKADRYKTDSMSPGDQIKVEEVSHRSFSSVLEAVESAAKECTNIEILPSARKAAKNSPFKRPYDVYRALSDLNEFIDELKKNNKQGKGVGLMAHINDRGWGKRCSMRISPKTLGKHKSKYEFMYQGEKMLFEPHITIGSGVPSSCASVHFVFIEKEKKIIVGHVGRHLPNETT